MGVAPQHSIFFKLCFWERQNWERVLEKCSKIKGFQKLMVSQKSVFGRWIFIFGKFLGKIIRFWELFGKQVIVEKPVAEVKICEERITREDARNGH